MASRILRPNPSGSGGSNSESTAGRMSDRASTYAEEVGRKADADANHRGGGEGGSADLHASAADGDALMRRAEPSGNGAPATGDTGEQVSPAQNAATAFQHFASGGATAAQFMREHMLMAISAYQAMQQQQQQQARQWAQQHAMHQPQHYQHPQQQQQHLAPSAAPSAAAAASDAAAAAAAAGAAATIAQLMSRVAQLELAGAGAQGGDLASEDGSVRSVVPQSAVGRIISGHPARPEMEDLSGGGAEVGQTSERSGRLRHSQAPEWPRLGR